MYFKIHDIKADSDSTTEVIQIPAEAPSGTYEVQLPSLAFLNSSQVRVYNQGQDSTWNLTLASLYDANKPIINSSNGLTQGYFAYDVSNNSCYTNLASGESFLRCSLFVNHITGIPTSFFRIEEASEGWNAGSFVDVAIMRQIV